MSANYLKVDNNVQPIEGENRPQVWIFNSQLVADDRWIPHLLDTAKFESLNKVTFYQDTYKCL